MRSDPEFHETVTSPPFGVKGRPVPVSM
jgi:hypothetical protein